jgi:hypothetical protein
MGVNDENNTCLTTPRRKSSSGDSAFAGRMFAAARDRAKLLLLADVGNKKARAEFDARPLREESG